MGVFFRDLRFALRSFARNPGFAAVTVATLTLGIGATTSVFSVVDAVVLRPLPYPEPDRLVRLYATDAQRGDDRDNTSPANFLDWKARSVSFEEVAGFVGGNVNLTHRDHPTRIRGASVTPEFFSVLGVDAARGRVFSPEVDTPGGELALVVSDAFWRSQLGGSRDALGRPVALDDEPYTVVGVMPPGFDYPPGVQLWTAARFRVPDPPVNIGEDPTANRGAQYIDAIARLKSSVSVEGAQAEMGAIAEWLESEYPDSNKDEGIAVVGLQESIVAEARLLLFMLLGAVGFVLLIACANVANLLLARSSQRERELAIRMAMGASRSRIVRQLLTESLLLAACGGVFGVALASWGAEGLLALAPEGIPRAAEVAVDSRVLAFTSLAVMATGILFGLAPVPQLFRHQLQLRMKEGAGGYTVVGGGRRLRRGLVVAEVALSLVLLVGTGMMVRTFMKLTAVEPGFNTSKALVAHVALPRARYDEDDQLRAFQARVLERLQSSPGVEAAGTVLTLPMHWNISGFLGFSIEGRPTPDGEGPSAGYQVVSTNYFRMLSIPLRRGRFFTEADAAEAPQVALVNEALAQRCWPDEDPIGKRISWGTDPDGEGRLWVTIVGVVGDTHVEGLDVPPRPETYRPYRQDPFPYLTLVVRGEGDTATLTSAIRRAVVEVDPGQPVYGVKTMDEVLSSSMAPRRFNMLLLGVFALAALLMAGVGLYGVLSFSVSQRSHEIGIRRALGARPGDVIMQILREGLGLVLVGLAIGTAGALALTRLIATLVHGVSATDPPSYAVGMVILAAVALGASYLPARRAARVDPMVALRYE